MTRADITFAGYEPGGLSTLCALQSSYYARAWGFTQAYESVVAATVGEFLQRFAPDRDFVGLVKSEDVVKGGIVIDSRDGKIAQLRWFILSDDLRGNGVGQRLMADAMAFVKEKRFPQVYLTTFQGLDSARHLYEQAGFLLTSSQPGTTWGRQVMEQRFDWRAGGDGG